MSNITYNDSDSENKGDSDYRKTDAPGVDLYKKATGVVVGYNNEGDWLEYTVNIAEAGDYTMVASVATENSTSSFSLSMDGKSVADKVALSGSSFDVFADVKQKVTLPAGKHVLRLTVTGAWFDIDYLNFVKGDVVVEPPADTSGGKTALPTNIALDNNVLQDYYVFGQNGTRMGVLSAYGFGAAAEILQNSSAVSTSGVYYLKNRRTGEMQSVRVVR